jgi:general secretion pathway protein D
VRIEVVIAEVSISDEAHTGIDSLGLQVTNDKLTGIGGGGGGLGLGATGTAGGIASGLAASTQLASRHSLSGFVGLITTPRKNNTTIYSRPTITALHNTSSRIFFGETRPVITASTTNDTSGSRTSSVTQMEIGTRIDVIPIIGYDGTVQLTLQQEISDVTGNVIVDGNPQYVIGKRNTNSTVIVKSGEIIVLGGMQKSSSLKTNSRLGPIPIVGDLLGKRSRSKVRNELIFFLRPIVLTNTDADNAPAMEQLEKMDVIKDDVKKSLGKEPAVKPESAPAPKPVAASRKKR